MQNRQTVKMFKYMIQELAVLGGPSDLHYPWCDDRHLVVPNAWIHTECTAHALKGRGITSCLKKRTTRGKDSDFHALINKKKLVENTFIHTQPDLKPSGWDLEVLANIIAVEHGVDICEVDFFVSELTTFLQDWTKSRGRKSIAHLGNVTLQKGGATP